jgi:hypothetical protein
LAVPIVVFDLCVLCDVFLLCFSRLSFYNAICRGEKKRKKQLAKGNIFSGTGVGRPL